MKPLKLFNRSSFKMMAFSSVYANKTSTISHIGDIYTFFKTNELQNFEALIKQ
jgi:hypothetical protein